jgi:hypothetical protein
MEDQFTFANSSPNKYFSGRSNNSDIPVFSGDPVTRSFSDTYVLDDTQSFSENFAGFSDASPKYDDGKILTIPKKKRESPSFPVKNNVYMGVNSSRAWGGTAASTLTDEEDKIRVGRLIKRLNAHFKGQPVAHCLLEGEWCPIVSLKFTGMNKINIETMKQIFLGDTGYIWDVAIELMGIIPHKELTLVITICKDKSHGVAKRPDPYAATIYHDVCDRVSLDKFTDAGFPPSFATTIHPVIEKLVNAVYNMEMFMPPIETELSFIPTTSGSESRNNNTSPKTSYVQTESHNELEPSGVYVLAFYPLESVNWRFLEYTIKIAAPFLIRPSFDENGKLELHLLVGQHKPLSWINEIVFQVNHSNNNDNNNNNSNNKGNPLFRFIENAVKRKKH